MTSEKFEALINLGTYTNTEARLLADLEVLGGVERLPKSVRVKLMEVARKLTPVNPMGMRAYFYHLGQNYKGLAELALVAYDAGRCQGTQEV